MELLNTKSVMGGLTEAEETDHYDEIWHVIDKLQGADPWGKELHMTKRYVDKGHKDIPAYNEITLAGAIYDAMDSCDCKNGCDAYKNDNGNIVFRIYGQSYKMTSDNKWRMVVTDLEFSPVERED